MYLTFDLHFDGVADGGADRISRAASVIPSVAGLDVLEDEASRLNNFTPASVLNNPFALRNKMSFFKKK